MRISQLSERSGVPVPTIKFYLREGLLHDGQLTSATQARYDESHLARLRLVLALLGPGGLTVATAKQVLHQIDHPSRSTHALLGAAHQAVMPAPDDSLDLSRARALIERWGWQIQDADRRGTGMLERALQALDDADFTLSDETLDRYAEMMHQLATAEIADIPTDSTAAAVRYVVLGTVLIEPLLLAMRRVAEQDASYRRFGDGKPETRQPD